MSKIKPIEIWINNKFIWEIERDKNKKLMIIWDKAKDL